MCDLVERIIHPVERHVRIAVAAGVAIMLLALPLLGVDRAESQQATPGAAPCPPGTPTASQCVPIDMRDIYYEPNYITIPADTPVQIVLVNRGVVPHNFSVTDHGNPGLPNLNVSVDVRPGETATVTLDAPAGLYYFYSDVGGYLGHEMVGMRGYLEVVSGAAIATAQVTATPRAD
jgi:plastocyanin